MEGWVAPWTGRAFDHAIIEWIADPPFRPPALDVWRWRGYEVPVAGSGRRALGSGRGGGRGRGNCGD